MIKIAVKIYHDSIFSHKFRNKSTKIKMSQFVFLSFKFVKNDQSTFFFSKKFQKFVVKNQMIFFENYDTIEKKMSIHEKIFKFHANAIARLKKKIPKSNEKMSIQKTHLKIKNNDHVF